MHKRFTIAQRVISVGLVTTFLSCSGPLVDVKSQISEKGKSVLVTPPQIKLSCNILELEGGGTSLEVINANAIAGLGDRLRLSTGSLGLGDKPLPPLDFSCNANNELIWVSADMINFVKLNVLSGKFSVSTEPVLGLTYTDVVEYMPEETKVISAGILKDAALPWDKTPIATITNTGVLQFGTYSMHTFETGEHNRFLYDLRSSKVLSEDQRWPKEGVGSAIVSPIDEKTVCVIPLGDSNQSVKYFYLVHYTGKDYKDLGDVVVLTMMPQSIAPDLRNIVSATVPAFNPAEGKGLNVVLEYKTTSGKTAYTAVLLPDPKEVFKD